MEYDTSSFRSTLEQVLDFQSSEQFKERLLSNLNLKLIDCDEGNKLWADYYFKGKEAFLNPYNGIHGGIACALADSVMGFTLCGATQCLPSTTNISVSYLRPMPDVEYRLHVEIKHSGKQLATCTCEIINKETETLCVSVMGTFVLIKKDLLA